MKRKINTGFDRIACVYDFLARIVFFGQIRKAQLHFLSLIQEGDSVLILGGGTGWIIEDIKSIAPTAKLTFIDSSSKMISLARERVHDESVFFIHGTEDDVPENHYNFIITNFYLDLFSEEKLPELISRIKRKLPLAGIWIATDFVNASWWHRVMLKTMFTFFKISAGIENSKLPNWDGILSRALKRKSAQNFYRGFIRSVVFER